MISFFKYFRIFEQYLGSKIYIMFLISIISGLLEGFGILALLPILDTNSSNEVSIFAAKIFSLFSISSGIISLSIFILIIFLLKSILIFFLYYVRSVYSGKLLYKLKYNLFNSYTNIKYNYFLARNTGHFTNIINEQTNLMLKCFWLLSEIFTQFINSSFYLAFAIYTSWHFGLVSILISAIFLILFSKLNLKIKKISKLVLKESKFLTQSNIQFFQSFKYLLSTNKIRIFDKNVKSSVSKLADAQKKIGMATGLSSSLREPFSIIFLLLFICFNNLFLENPIANLLASALFFYKSINSITLIQLNRQKLFENIASLETVNSEFKSSLKNKEESGKKEIKNFKNQINFKDVYFKYKTNDSYILKNINISFNTKETTSIIGKSGCGKTTLIELITLINQPTMGDIFIDGFTNKQINLKSWRNNIGYVPQSPFIFSDTIANNIMLTPLNILDKSNIEKIRFYSKQAFIDDFVQSLPEKYNTKIGDGGLELSGGQRQRICIARELYRNPTVLILDEATSALDRESEIKVQKSLNHMRGNMTIIIIAHRLETIKYSDNIAIMEEGKIIEIGSYRKLANKKGSYLNYVLNL